MESDIDFLKRVQSALVIAVIFMIIAIGLSFVKNIVIERWALKRDNVACIPSDVDFSHPIVYHQSAANPVNQDALIKTFVAQYVHLTQDEQIIDYHTVRPEERYKDAQLSSSKWTAIQMSTGKEKEFNVKAYAKSTENFYLLKKNNMGWNFLIDDILLFGAPHTGSVLALVRGQFQVTYDNVKTDLPPHLWGYREVYLLLNQGEPSRDSKGQYINQYGWYVSWSAMQQVSQAKKQKLSELNHDYYLMDEFKNKGLEIKNKEDKK